MWKLWSECREEGEREEEKVEHFSEESVMEWQKAKLLLEKSERHDESGLEPDLLCVCVCVCVDEEGKLGWTAVRELVSRDVWQTQLPSLALQLPVDCYCTGQVLLRVCMCSVNVWFCDFQWLCVYSMVLVCLMGEVGMLPGNPEADLVYLSSNDRNLPSKLQLSYKAAVMAAKSQCRWCCVS